MLLRLLLLFAAEPLEAAIWLVCLLLAESGNWAGENLKGNCKTLFGARFKFEIVFAVNGVFDRTSCFGVQLGSFDGNSTPGNQHTY